MSLTIRILAVCAAGLAVSACGGSGGSNGSTTSAGGTSSGPASATTGSASAGSAAASSGSTGGATSSGGLMVGTSGGMTGGTSGETCAPGAIWNGSVCALSVCTAAETGAGCLGPDGGAGECFGIQCVNVSDDPLHCGSPETACALGLACDAGSCVGSVGCTADGGCPVGDTCQPGARVCLPDTCDSTSGQRYCSGGRCCGDTCTALNDPENCGACGVSCGSGRFCFFDAPAGALECADCSTLPDNTVCGIGRYCCGGSCVPVGGTDPLNCGACGNICPGGATGTCNGGFCSGDCSTCPAGTACFTLSGGITVCWSQSCTAGHDGMACGQGGTCCGSSCLAGGFAADPNNCGACGVACADGDVCRNGVCLEAIGCLFSGSGSPCLLDGGEGICCSGSCTDLESNSGNCGACGQGCRKTATCSRGTCSAECGDSSDCVLGAACIEGLCQASCESRQDGDTCTAEVDGGVYGGECCGGQCVTVGDTQNCGGCGLICPPGIGCFAGGCRLPSFAAFDCGGEGSTPCPRGYGCSSTGAAAGDACAPQDCMTRSNGDPCAFGPNQPGECCQNICVGTESDNANCGGCGFGCASDTCEQGQCLPLASSAPCMPACGPGSECLGGVCVDSLCTTASCVTETGSVGACCADGACVDLRTDALNCGGCGLSCPAGESCVFGDCQGDACSVANAGAYCGLPDPGEACCGNACIDVTTDVFNCGQCGRACVPGAACTNGNCG